MKTVNIEKKIIALLLILSIVIMVPENRVFAAGKKEKVYVITKVTVDGGNRVMKYNYSANGLITKVTDSVKSGTHTISYSGTKIKKRTFKDYNYAYGYNNKGQLINVKFSNQWKRDHEYYLTFEYDKNNRIKFYNMSNARNESYKIIYDKKGRVDRQKNEKTTIKYSYNDKGYVKQEKITSLSLFGKNTEKITYKYKYNKGGLVTEVTSNNGHSTTVKKIEYKLISISKTYSKVIKEQQDSLLGIPNNTFFQMTD